MSPRRHVVTLAAAAILTVTGATIASAADFSADQIQVRSPVDARSPVDSDGDYGNLPDNGNDSYGHRPRPPWGWGGYGLPRVEARISYAGDRLPPGALEAEARAQAIQAWRAKVSYRYGERFAHWRAARDKYIDCGRSRRTVTCVASARPRRGWGGWSWNTGY